MQWPTDPPAPGRAREDAEPPPDAGEDAEPARYRVTLLGGFSLLSRGQEVRVPSSSQHLIALLALRSAPARGHVSGMLWPDVPDEQASGRLRTAVWRVQKLCPALLCANGPVLSLAGSAVVDVRIFLRSVHLLLQPDSVLDHGVLADLSWTDLLPGWYEDWVLVERERLQQLQLHALEDVAVRLLRQGRPTEALDAALVATRVEPLRESAQRLVAQVHLQEGNHAEAVRQYLAYRARLQAEMDLLPSAEFTRMLGSVAPQQHGLVAPRRPGSVPQVTRR